MEDTEIGLVSRCQAGDERAFEALYRTHSSRVYSLAARFTGSRLEAEDVVQEVFLVVFRRLSAFRREASLSTWIHRITVNKCVDRLRRKGARLTEEPMDADRLPLARTGPQDGRMAGRMDLERAIGTLPDGCRAVFVLHDVEGFTHAEVARQLGIAEGTSKSQLFSARARLRGMLPAPGAENGVVDVRQRVC